MIKKLNVLHIVAGDLTMGAARGALWLHNGMLDHGINSHLLTNSILSKDYENVTTISNNSKRKFENFIKNKLDKVIKLFYRKSADGIFSSGFIGTDIRKLEVYKNCDIINFHWINNGFINMNIFKKIDKPIFWTIRDMWPFTGGCHYAVNCDNYLRSCGNCKLLNTNKSFDASRFIHKRKSKFYKKDIQIIAISNWLADEAKKSSLLSGFNIKMIPNNYDSNIFFPVNKLQSKEIMGIKTNKKIILTGSININAEWKGYKKFVEALDFLDSDKYMLCTFGKGDTTNLLKKGFEVISLGFLYDDISLRIAYSMADVFVAPSLLEAFGKTIVEAMGCGTPVVCFDATGPKDLVDHKVSGYKAKPYFSEDLAKGITWVIDNINNKASRDNIISKVLNNYDKSVIAKSYIDLYKTILN